MRFVLFVLAALVATIHAAYLVGYQPSSADDQQIVNGGVTFAAAPTAEQLADLYTRVSGIAPILWETTENLPGANPLSKNIVKAQIVEVVGGVLPETVSAIASADYADGLPTLNEVVSVLSSHGVEVVSKKLDATGDKADEVHRYLTSQQVPVLVLHHNLIAPRRMLTANNVTELTDFEIADYQITLWAAVVFVLLVGSAICGVANMEVEPDSLLYAKFQSGRTEAKRE